MNIGPELDSKLASLEPEAKEIAIRMVQAVMFKHVDGPKELSLANETLELMTEAHGRVGTESADKAYEKATLASAAKLQKALHEPLGYGHIARSERKNRRGRPELSNVWGKKS